MIFNLFRTKPIASEVNSGLKRCLTAVDLTFLGVGAVIGAGIFVLTGIAAATKAGPAIVISYLIAGFAAALSALSYAELAATIGCCGSAYGYAYAGFGELIAWIIGWDLLLEYGISTSAVAVGWSGYINNALQTMGFSIPAQFLHGPFEGGIFNLPATLIIFIIAILLSVGIRESARFNIAIVFVKLLAIAVFLMIAFFHVQFNLWQPFAPFGWQGIVSGSALIFFAYIGFDAVSTTTEEALNPQRNLPIGIIASLIICTIVYVLVSGLLTLIVPYSTLNVSSPVASALLQLGYRFGGGVVAAGAIAGLTSVILVMYYGFTRIFLAMSRDKLLPQFFAKINLYTQTPVRLILCVGVIMAAIAGVVPLENIAQLVNIGTLAAFCLVCGGVIILRYTHPELPRSFKVPFSPLIPGLGILSCLYLIFYLGSNTWWRFFIWMAAGLLFYFFYSYKRSALRTDV